MAFEDRLAGFDIKLVVPETAGFTIGTIGVLSGAPHPRTARAFIEFMLSERGQKVAMARGVFPIIPKYHVQGAAGSTAELAVQFVGGIRSYFDHEVKNVYDDDLAQKRYEQIDSQFRTQIEAVWEELKRKY
jgi:ABC-type Fe3+ transport system substrate-binding protein